MREASTSDDRATGPAVPAPSVNGAAPADGAARVNGWAPAEIAGSHVPQADPAPVRPGRGWLPHLLGGLTAVLLYGLLRALGLWALQAYAGARGHTLPTLLTRADGDWYMVIAQRGYDLAVPIAADGGPGPTNLAFFPLYPGLVALVDGWVPWDIQVVQVVVAAVAAVAAAAGLYAIGAHLHSRRAGIFLAAVWGVLPHAIVETMGYSESLFTALAAWSLFAVLRRHWLTAGLLCIAAGLTRPTAVALIAAVGLAALVAVVRDWRQWRAWLAMVLAPLGTLGYLLWLSERLGRWDAYFYVQRDAWHQSFDWGVTTWRTAGELMRPTVPLPLIVVTVVMVAMIALFAVAIGARVPWPLLVYAAGVLVLCLGGDAYYWAKARMLLPAFTLLIPVAVAMARSRSQVVPAVVLAALTAVSAWYGIFVLLLWRGSP